MRGGKLVGGGEGNSTARGNPGVPKGPSQAGRVVPIPCGVVLWAVGAMGGIS